MIPARIAGKPVTVACEVGAARGRVAAVFSISALSARTVASGAFRSVGVTTKIIAVAVGREQLLAEERMGADLCREFRRQARRGVADDQRRIAVGVGRVAEGEEREDVVDAVDELKLELQFLQLGEILGRAEIGALDEKEVLVLRIDELLGDPHVVAVGVVLAGEDGAEVLVELDLGQAEDRRGDQADDRRRRSAAAGKARSRRRVPGQIRGTTSDGDRAVAVRGRGS